MNKTMRKSLSVALGSTFVAAMSAAPVANAETSPFGMQNLEGGYMQVAEGKCGEGKCGGKDKMKAKEAKCGEDHKKAHDGKCGGDKMKAKEAKCGEDHKKANEGKCGGKDKAKEAKCGEGKCGGKK